MTNMIITPKQSQGVCPEDIKFREVHCKTDSDCPKKKPVKNGNGIYICIFFLFIYLFFYYYYYVVYFIYN